MLFQRREMLFLSSKKCYSGSTFAGASQGLPNLVSLITHFSCSVWIPGFYRSMQHCPEISGRPKRRHCIGVCTIKSYKIGREINEGREGEKKKKNEYDRSMTINDSREYC